jgi:hypothetical protein
MSGSQPTLDFPLLSRKALQVDFSGGTLSSDGGLLLLAQLDRQLRLTERVAALIRDTRLPERIQHPLIDLLRQRVYQIVAGYEDCNDADRLRGDPALKVAVGRCPQKDPDLGSQATLSRLETNIAEEECAAINALLLTSFLECPRRPPSVVVLDFDPSEDPTHGQQEFAFFNGHYDSYCYLPLFVFARASGEDEEHLVSVELPEDHTRDPAAILATLLRLVDGIRARWPGVKVIFRADAGFAVPEIYEACEAAGIAYLIGLPGNAVLQAESQKWREQARRGAEQSPGCRVRCFGAFWYRAQGWRALRKVVVKAEVTPLGPNPRYVVTWGLEGTARELYREYARRGGCENRIKELKEAIKIDRTSCHEFASNMVRLMLHAVAYVLFQRLRRLAIGTGLLHTQVEGLRLRLIKIAAQVRESGRRVHVALCSSCPSQEAWVRLARRLGVPSG